MTRDAKIGLLVGLLFVIMVGIYLMQYLTGANEPVTADMDKTAKDVREGVETPNGPEDGPPITVAGGTPLDQPQHVLRTREDLKSAPLVTFVPPAPRGSTPGPIVQSDFSTNDASPPPHAPRGAGAPQQVAQGGSDGSGQAAQRFQSPVRLSPGAAELLKRHPDELAAVGPGGVEPAENVKPPAGQGQPEYTAVEGDSVSRMAGRLMGGNTRANRDALIAANPMLQAEGSPVITGRKYVIPKVMRGLPTPAPAVVARNSDTTATAEPARYYTVKGNDNLWKIAEAELGTGTAWTVIRDMNKDVLKGGETVHPEMRLRLPARAGVAATND